MKTRYSVQVIKAPVWVVITTINPPVPRITDFLQLGWQIVIVADRKTPQNDWESFANEGLHFFSLEDQSQKYPLLSKLIGENTYARKNLGYLFALEFGAQTIFDTDDDTFFRTSAIELLNNIAEFRNWNVTGEGWFNPYVLFCPNTGLWPRGYPINLVSADRWHLNPKLNIDSNSMYQPPDIIQTLVNLEPDVDSIYRMTVSDEVINFPISNDLYHVEWPVVSPANTQSTFWIKRSSFEYLYIPATVSFRFMDILKMFIAQSRHRLAYAGFLSDQFRNPHDYMKDFESEISCFLNTSKVVSILQGSEDSPLQYIYELLEKEKICETEEIQIFSAFNSEVSRIENERLAQF
jgi:hypothetical protein